MHGFRAVNLQSTGLAHSSEFTRTLFIEFAAHEALTKLSEQLRWLAAPSSPYVLNPHLSLVYAPLDAGIRERLTREISVPVAMRFITVKAVATGAVNLKRTDVEAWRELAEMNLTGD